MDIQIEICFTTMKKYLLRAQSFIGIEINKNLMESFEMIFKRKQKLAKYFANLS